MTAVLIPTLVHGRGRSLHAFTFVLIRLGVKIMIRRIRPSGQLCEGRRFEKDYFDVLTVGVRLYEESL